MSKSTAARPAFVARNNIPRPALRRLSRLRGLLNSAFFIVSALIFSELALPRSAIDGPSMQPTLFTGQTVLVSRVHYLLDNPQRGDIAVFEKPKNPQTESLPPEMLIKRVIAVPGDTVELRPKIVVVARQEQSDADFYVNGVLVEEPYFINRPCNACNGYWTLGPDEYFLVGDNRNQSTDSRGFGAVPRDHILGKAIWRYWPLDKFGTLYP